MATSYTIETRFHGRFLREDRGGERFLAGFHGYAETADVHLAELHKIVGISDWSLVAIQALNRFYTRDEKIVANWMTSQDRELAIADNISYVRAVIDTLPQPRTLVFLGFSQGAAMAARAAVAIPCDGLIILGGDIPPDVKAAEGTLPPVLLARGVRDDWYSDGKFKDDLRFLEGRTRVTSLVFDGGHEWSDAFREAASVFLRTMNDEL
ncbi:MAG TPA: phospholipase [Thermoanaerobaculia bacterium]|nr:phospholipase [Thermoanaerobaculia bacterium]